MTKLIKEAIADANAVQLVAEERAKSMLIKEFSPRIKSALASLISEEGVSTGSDQPGGYSPETDKDAIAAGVPAGQSSDDLSQDGAGPEKIQEDDDLPVEDGDDEPVLEGDDEMDAVDDDEFGGVAEELELGDDESGEDEVLEIVDDVDEPGDTGEIPPSIDEDGEDELDVDDDKPADAIMELRKKNFRLAKHNRQLREAISTLHGKFKRIDLFNAKLAYAFKLMTTPGLSRNQKRTIAETFDSAKTVREAQLIYKTLKGGVASTPNKKRPLQNRNVKSVLSESTRPQNSSYNRMSELAGL